MFDTNFFLIKSGKSTANTAVKEAVSIYYYIMKVIAVVLELIMLIYLGIRMALSTIASETAKYKEMLKDWLVSIVLIFAMPYIIGFINWTSRNINRTFCNS